MVHEIVGTFIGRWYVTTFGVAFLVLAGRHLGWRRTAIYTAGALVVGIVAENASVHLGVPYTKYAFNSGLRGKELFVGSVPLMVSLSYTFMSYFAFASARLIVAGPYRTRSSMPVLEFVTAVVIGVWAIWIVDPVSRLGSRFFLGELFRYQGPGFWFGLPLGSQFGFTLTVGILVGLLTWLMRDEPANEVNGLAEHPRLGALGGFMGQIIFMAATAFFVARRNPSPAVVAEADALAGAAVIIWLPAALAVVVHWRALTLARKEAGTVRAEQP